MDNLAICLVTYRSDPSRTDTAVRTIRTTCQNLKYPKEHIKWFINDDGSEPLHVEAILNELSTQGHEVGYINTERINSRGEKRSASDYNCAHGWNLALHNAHLYSDWVLWLEDDWELRVPNFNILEYMEVIRQLPEVGMMRFGVMARDSKVMITAYDPRVDKCGVHFLDYIKETRYAYSGNPHLRHARFTNAYGLFNETRCKNPGEIETEMDYRFRSLPGPAIWRPVNISPWGAWEHIGEFKSFA